MLTVSGAAFVSPALASEEPLPADPSDQIESAFATCFGQTVDMWVPPGGGTFYGDNNDNVIMGTGGDDTIYGEGGIDGICQPESDRTSGLLGLDPTADDGIDPGVDNDVAYGGPGVDFLDPSAPQADCEVFVP